MSEHEKSTRKKSMGAEKFHAFMKNKLAVIFFQEFYMEEESR